MQHIDVVCVGKLTAPYLAAGVADYQKRLGPFCRFRIIEIPAAPLKEKAASGGEIERALAQEAAAIRKVCRGSYLVALCVEGEAISSEDLARLLQTRAESGAGDIAFVIGSSFGLAQSLKREANARISLGRITLPHQLARLVLCEQIYRACTINAGMKYHK